MLYTINELTKKICKKDEQLLKVLSKYDRRLQEEGLIEIIRPKKIINRQVKIKVNDFESLVDSLVELADR